MTDHITCADDLDNTHNELAALQRLHAAVTEADLAASNLEYHGVEFAPIKDDFGIVRGGGNSVAETLSIAAAQIAVEIERRKDAIAAYTKEPEYT